MGSDVNTCSNQVGPETAFRDFGEKPTKAQRMAAKARKELETRDYTEEQVDKILTACSPYQVTGRDTPAEVAAFLSNFDALKGIVSTSFRAASMENYFDHTSLTGRLSTCIGSFLAGGCGDCGEEKMNLERIWQLLREVGAGPKQLNYVVAGDKMIMSKGKVYAFGDEREEAEAFEDAKAELAAKMVDLPPAAYAYGKLNFLICYAAAGQLIQFFMIRLGKPEDYPVLSPVTELLDSSADLPRLLLYYIKLYFLLLGMDASARAELLLPLPTYADHGACEIKLSFDGTVKGIWDFEAYSSEYNVCFAAIKAAYAAAEACDGYMITSVFGPHLEEVEEERELSSWSEFTEGDSSSTSSSASVTQGELTDSASTSGSRKRRLSSSAGNNKGSSKRMRRGNRKSTKVYVVETRRLCARREPKTEVELQDMAYGVLRALRALHNAGLVHTDIRFSNVKYDSSENKYVLINLETVCKPGVSVLKYRTWDWNEGTLDEHNRYTKLSDFHQLGIMLQSSSKVEQKSKACQEFINLLLSKTPGTTAESLLQHKWMAAPLW